MESPLSEESEEPLFVEEEPPHPAKLNIIVVAIAMASNFFFIILTILSKIRKSPKYPFDTSDFFVHFPIHLIKKRKTAFELASMLFSFEQNEL